MKKNFKLSRVLHAKPWMFLPILTLLLFSCNNNLDEELAEPVTKEVVNPYFVSEEEAVSAVEALLADIDGDGTRASGTRRHVESIQEVGGSAKTRAADEMASSVYLLNFTNDEGFALASTDSRTLPVFCIADEGSLNPNDSISDPGLAVFLSNLDEALADTTSGIWLANVQDTLSVTEVDEDATTRSTTQVGATSWVVTDIVSPRLKVNWSQGDPYNASCPYIINKGLAAAGCTAIATAQICSYFKFPTSYKEHIYNWRDILRQNKYYSGYPYPADLPVLIHDIGVAINTDYGVPESGAHAKDAANLLKSFGYYTQKISSNEIHSYMKTRIQNSLVLARGAAKKSTQWLFFAKYDYGHDWVIDGCMTRTRTATMKKTGFLRKTKYYTTKQTQELLHCNFGWGGASNGYYLAGAFNNVYDTENTILDSALTGNEDLVFKYDNEYWIIKH